VRTGPRLLRVLLVKLVIDFPTFNRNGIQPGRRKRFQWIRRLRVRRSNPEIDEIAGIANDQTRREEYKRPFCEQPQASFIGHREGV